MLSRNISLLYWFTLPSILIMYARTTSKVVTFLLAATFCATYLNKEENDAPDFDYDEVRGMVSEELETLFSSHDI